MGGGAPQALEVRRDGSVVRLGGGAGGGGESGRRGSLGAALALRGGWRRRLLPRPAFGSVWIRSELLLGCVSRAAKGGAAAPSVSLVGLLCSAAVSSAAACDML